MQLFHSLGLSDALPSEDVSWKEWLVSFFCSLSIKDRDVVLLTYWAIWFTRNRVVHDGVIASVPDTYTFVEVPPESVAKFNFDLTFSFQVVLFARDLGFSSIIIEGDSLTAIKKLNASNSDKYIISPIAHDIKILTRGFDSFSFYFVWRDAYNTIHVLAYECRFQ
ncbi:hypothetical protein V6N13_112057 [Hibiscus sabdariffa]